MIYRQSVYVGAIACIFAIAITSYLGGRKLQSSTDKLYKANAILNTSIKKSKQLNEHLKNILKQNYLDSINESYVFLESSSSPHIHKSLKERAAKVSTNSKQHSDRMPLVGVTTSPGSTAAVGFMPKQSTEQRKSNAQNPIQQVASSSSSIISKDTCTICCKRWFRGVADYDDKLSNFNSPNWISYESIQYYYKGNFPISIFDKNALADSSDVVLNTSMFHTAEKDGETIAKEFYNNYKFFILTVILRNNSEKKLKIIANKPKNLLAIYSLDKDKYASKGAYSMFSQKLCWQHAKNLKQGISVQPGELMCLVIRTSHDLFIHAAYAPVEVSTIATVSIYDESSNALLSSSNVKISK